MSESAFSINICENGNIDSGKKSKKTEKNKRGYKGTNANKHVNDYCVVDLETTGVFLNFSDIIEISAIRVRDNAVVSEYSTLVNPQYHIPEEATAVNHITDDMVIDAPLLTEVIDSFLDFVGNDIIVGYNNAGYDMNLLYDDILRLKGKYFSNDYLDVLHAVRRTLQQLENAKLETVCNYYGLDIAGEHRALKDCYMTKECYDKLFEEFGEQAFHKVGHSSPGKKVQFSADTIALQQLQLLLEGFLEDGFVTRDEVDSLRCWLEEHRELSGHYPFDKAYSALDDVLEDGYISEDELDVLKTIFAEIVDPVKSQKHSDTIADIADKHVCLTGDFDYGKRSDVEILIEKAGGFIDSSVKKATDYLVVGAQGSDAWKTGKYGAKIQKAMEYNSKGAVINIVEEKDFIPAVEYLAEHPEEFICQDNVTNSSNWISIVQKAIVEVINEEELPLNSVSINENTTKDKKGALSYSVVISEPVYPPCIDKSDAFAKSTNIVTIFEKGSELELLVGKNCVNSIGIAEGSELKEKLSDKLYDHILISIDSLELCKYIKNVIYYEYSNYLTSSDAFGCCSKYIECSNAKKCVHENKLYSKACMYRKNLDEGKIFYGDNRNID